MELLAWPGATTHQTAILEEFIDSSFVYPLDEPVILKAIEIRKFNKLKLPDAIIAATALINNFTLITRNEKDFSNIEGFNLLNPHKV